MIMWKAVAGLILVVAALAFAAAAFYRAGYTTGYQARADDMAERRAQRRAEQRARAASRGHELAPFPDEQEFEKLATTGELSAYAETGDLGSLERETAAFFRILALRDWTRKRETAA